MILLKLFLIAFFINLLYEMLHSMLYQTCYEVGLKKYIYLIVKGALFDGFSITIVYLICASIFKPQQVILSFSIILVILAYFWELYAIKNKRWKYTKNMPIVLGVGLTPLIQLFLTGTIALYITLNL